jgi:hypothetical protein
MQALMKVREGKSRAETDYQLLKHQQKIAALCRDISNLLEVCSHYMPAAYTIEEDATSKEPSVNLWERRIWLPSDLPSRDRLTGCI